MTFAGFGQYEVDGKTYVTDRDRPRGKAFGIVSDGYFKTLLGLKILEGRDFTIEDDDAKQPVAIVNSAFARKLISRQRKRVGSPHSALSIPRKRSLGGRSSGVVPDTQMQGPFNQQIRPGWILSSDPWHAAEPAVRHDRCPSA